MITASYLVTSTLDALRMSVKDFKKVLAYANVKELNVECENDFLYHVKVKYEYYSLKGATKGEKQMMAECLSNTNHVVNFRTGEIVFLQKAIEANILSNKAFA